MTETTAPTVLRANNPADFLAALPRITGMDATECAFIVMFDGKRTIGAARIDLPPLDQLSAPSAETTHWFREVANLAARAAAVAVVVKTEQQLSARPATSPHGQLTWMTCNVLAALDRGPRDALVVGSDGWASFAGGTARPELRPLSAISSSPLHDPGLKNPSLDEWREAHPDQSTTAPEEIDAMAARMRAAG